MFQSRPLGEEVEVAVEVEEVEGMGEEDRVEVEEVEGEEVVEGKVVLVQRDGEGEGVKEMVGVEVEEMLLSTFGNIANAKYSQCFYGAGVKWNAKLYPNQGLNKVIEQPFKNKWSLRRFELWSAPYNTFLLNGRTLHREFKKKKFFFA